MDTQKLLRQMTLIVLCILVLGAGTLSLLAMHATAAQDQAWGDNQRHVLSSIIRTRASDLFDLAAEYASRGDFRENRQQTADAGNSRGDTVPDIFGISLAGIASPDGTIRLLIHKSPGQNTSLVASYHVPASPSDTFAIVDGQPGFWATAPLTNSKSGNSLFLFAPMNERFIRDLSVSTGIRSLSILTPASRNDKEGGFSLTLSDANAKPIAYLVWPREYPDNEPGSNILQPVMLILAVMIVLTHFVIKRTQIVADRFDGVKKREIERSARIKKMSQNALGLIDQENVTLEEGEVARKISERLDDALNCDTASYWRLSEGETFFRAVDLYRTKTGEHTDGETLDVGTSALLIRALSSQHALVDSGYAATALAAKSANARQSSDNEDKTIVAGIFLDGRISGFVAATSVAGRIWMEEEISYVSRLADIAALWIEARQRQQAQEKAIFARDAAERANQAKGDFLAKMSHELRTPLNSIIGFAGIMADEENGAIDDLYKGYSSDIRESGIHLLAIINDILDTARLEHGSFEISRQPVDLLQTALAVRRIMSGRAVDHDIDIDILIPGTFPALHADERRLRQILINLISNSIKFSHQGGHIAISAEADGDMAWIEISDDGIGMTEQEIAYAIEPFRQVDNGLDRKHEGTGLGLPITRGLVALHGGEFIIESTPLQGTKIRFSIPLICDKIRSA